MRRRTVLTAFGVGSVAGVLSLGAPRFGLERVYGRILRGRHPHADGRVTVAVDVRGQPTDGFFESLRTVLGYWEDNAEQYAGFDVTYELRPDADAPDVVVAAVDSIPDCGADRPRGTLGCATYVSSDTLRIAPARVQVRGDLTGEELETTLKHEFGHTLGLEHDDEPSDVMAETPLSTPDNSDRSNGVIGLYAHGLNRHEWAIEAFEAGEKRYRNGSFRAAANRFQMAHWEARGGTVHFEDAHEIAIEVGNDAAIEICATAAGTMDSLTRSCEAFGAAATAAARDDDPDVERELARQRESHRRYLDGDLPERQSLETAFGTRSGGADPVGST